jgi:hypothetical protein
MLSTQCGDADPVVNGARKTAAAPFEIGAVPTLGGQLRQALFEEAFVNPSARTPHLARKSCVGDWALLHLQQINSGRSRIGCNGSSGATPHDSQEIRTK